MKLSNINPVIPIGVGAGLLLLILLSTPEKPKGMDFKKLTATTKKGFIIVKCERLRFIDIPKMNEYLITQLKILNIKPQHVVPYKIDIIDFCEDFLYRITPDCYSSFLSAPKIPITKLQFLISYYIMYGALANYFDSVLKMGNPEGEWTKFFESAEQLDTFRTVQYQKFDDYFKIWFVNFGITKEQVLDYYQKINSGEIYEISAETLKQL